MNQKILDKIKKCLALSKSSNEHEAARALAQAQKIMKLHNLELSDIERSKINITESVARSSASEWHLCLVNTIRVAFCVYPIWSKNYFGLSVKFHGYGSSPEMAKYAYEVLYRQCANARKNYMKTTLKRVQSAARKTARANLYAQGWVIAVYGVINQFVTDNDKEHVQSIGDLVAKGLDSIKPRKSKAADAVKRNCNDADAGYCDGKNVKLHRPINGFGEQQKRLGG